MSEPLPSEAAEIALRAAQAEAVARATYRTDPEMFAYSIEQMRKERAALRRMINSAKSQPAPTEGGNS